MRPFDTKAFAPAISWARKHERQISALSLAGGFVFDSITFGRIDHAVTQAVFIVYLLVAGLAIAVLHALESRPDDKKPSDKTRTILVAVTQFALGCLLSGFCVFYIRSASITSSWPFLLAMAAIFIANEYLRRYHSRLVFSALLFFFALYSYAILLVPVVIARIGTVPFLMSGAVAVIVFFFFVRLLAILGHDRYKNARKQIAIGMAAITVLINVFYFAKIFPPLPLVLSDAGVYHDIKREGRNYQGTAEEEPPRWRALFGTFPIEHIQPNDKLYLYSAVFAPYRLTTNIVHQWEWRDPRNGNWVLKDRMHFMIHGGRADGYRTYSLKRVPLPGEWRVNILSDDGRTIGRVRFSV